MKQTLKKMAYGVGSTALLLPGLVSASSSSGTGGNGGFSTPGGTGLPQGKIYDIISKGMMWLLGLVGIIGVIGFAIAGIMYLTAAGDEERIKTAKKAMLMSIVGVIVALLGIVILQAAKAFLGGNDATF